jgi:hypothetical protein
MKSIIRDYEKDVIEPCKQYKDLFDIKIDKSFRLLSLKTKNKNPKKRIILSSGIHGSEPAGVLGIINNLELILKISKEKNYEFLIFPCINASGFERNSRENIDNIDLNRNFESPSNINEINFVTQSLNELEFKADLSIDFHETCPEDNCDITEGNDLPSEFYLYEVCTEPSFLIGKKILDNIRKDYKVCEWDFIFGDKSKMGLIRYPQESKASESFGGKTLDIFLFNNGFSKNSLTIETMSHYPMKDRINQIVKILNTI